MIRGMTLVVASLCLSQGAHADPETVARFRAEYPTAARRLQERFTHIKGQFQLEESRPNKSRHPRITRGEFAVSGKMEKVSFRRAISEKPSTEDPETVYCVGEDFAFKLTRLSTGRYQVAGIDRRAEIAVYNNIFGKYLKSPYSQQGFPLERMMANPKFRIDDAETIDQDGRSVVKVQCVLSGEIPQNMEFTFQPDAGWRIVEAMSQIANHTANMKIEYEQNGGSTVYPKKVSLLQGSEQVTIATFEKWSEATTPVNEFTMPYFGLPDLVSDAETSHHRGKTVLLCGAAVGFVLAGVLMIIARRGRSNAGPKG